MVKKIPKERRVRRPLSFAAVSLIVILVLVIASSFLSMKGFNILSSILSILVFAGTILVFVGFYYLGKRHNNQLLMKTIIAGFVLYLGFLALVSHAPENYKARFFELNDTLSARAIDLEQMKLDNISEEVIASFEVETAEYFLEKGLTLFIPILISLFIFAIYSTFFGIALIRLQKVKNSKAIGVLTILSAWLTLTLVGIILAIPLAISSYILSIFMFFDESKKAKE